MSMGGDHLHDSRYYNVHYQATQPFGKALSTVARDRHVMLSNLAPATSYEFKVRTVKGTQTSQYSATVTNRTFGTGKVLAPVLHLVCLLVYLRAIYAAIRYCFGGVCLSVCPHKISKTTDQKLM